MWANTEGEFGVQDEGGVQLHLMQESIWTTSGMRWATGGEVCCDMWGVR